MPPARDIRDTPIYRVFIYLAHSRRPEAKTATSLPELEFSAHFKKINPLKTAPTSPESERTQSPPSCARNLTAAAAG